MTACSKDLKSEVLDNHRGVGNFAFSFVLLLTPKHEVKTISSRRQYYYQQDGTLSDRGQCPVLTI